MNGEPAEAFRDYLARTRVRIDATLRRLLPGPQAKPLLIHRAMRYTALAEGKRLRPALVLLAYDTCGGRGRRADPVAAALEMVHAFSLIHDDLPAMDDDAVRRGKPANHVVFGEGIAILAGDALLALAFETLSGLRRTLGPETAAGLVAELGEAVGSLGVIGGQVLDLASEGKRVPRRTVVAIHGLKTARLFTAALRMGGMAAGASPARLRTLSAVGDAAGRAFQIVDDLLGAAGTFRELGREPGRDRERGKGTFPGAVGLEASHREAGRLLARARAAARALPANRFLFEGFCDALDRRRRDASGGLLGMKGAA